MSLLQPCTSSRTLVGVNVLPIAVGVAVNLDPGGRTGVKPDDIIRIIGTGSLILGEVSERLWALTRSTIAGPSMLG